MEYGCNPKYKTQFTVADTQFSFHCSSDGVQNFHFVYFYKFDSHYNTHHLSAKTPFVSYTSAAIFGNDAGVYLKETNGSILE